MIALACVALFSRQFVYVMVTLSLPWFLVIGSMLHGNMLQGYALRQQIPRDAQGYANLTVGYKAIVSGNFKILPDTGSLVERTTWEAHSFEDAQPGRPIGRTATGQPSKSIPPCQWWQNKLIAKKDKESSWIEGRLRQNAKEAGGVDCRPFALGFTPLAVCLMKGKFDTAVKLLDLSANPLKIVNTSMLPSPANIWARASVFELALLYEQPLTKEDLEKLKKAPNFWKGIKFLDLLKAIQRNIDKKLKEAPRDPTNGEVLTRDRLLVWDFRRLDYFAITPPDQQTARETKLPSSTYTRFKQRVEDMPDLRTGAVQPLHDLNLRRLWDHVFPQAWWEGRVS